MQGLKWRAGISGGLDSRATRIGRSCQLRSWALCFCADNCTGQVSMCSVGLAQNTLKRRASGIADGCVHARVPFKDQLQGLLKIRGQALLHIQEHERRQVPAPVGTE